MDCLVMPKYGCSLKDILISKKEKKFNLKTVCLIGIKMVIYIFSLK